MRTFVGVVVVGLCLGGCGVLGGGGSDEDPAPRPSGTVTSAPPVPTPPPLPDVPGNEGAGDAETCAEVVAGINAFNQGAYDETVEHFEKAVPLAEAADDGSTRAGLLLDAVRYYAQLPADDYPAAAASSADFQKWKAVTLGQCVDATPPTSSPTTAVPA